MELAMSSSSQTFISIAPYWDIIHRHRASFYWTLLLGLICTALALTVVPKQYTSSVLLEISRADVESSMTHSDASTQTTATDLHLESRIETLSEETVTPADLKNLIAKHGLYVRKGKVGAGAVG